MTERTERPTPARLEELREEGLVPLSSFAVRAAGTAGVLFSLYLLGEQWREFVSLPMRLGTLDRETLVVLRETCLPLILVPALAYLCAALVAGLLQTKFLIKPSAVSFQLGRLGGRRGGGVIGRIVGGLLLELFALSLAVLVAWFALSDIAQLLNNDQVWLMEWPARLGARVTLPLMAILILAATGGWLLSRMTFFREHRMTREEVRQSSREL